MRKHHEMRRFHLFLFCLFATIGLATASRLYYTWVWLPEHSRPSEIIAFKAWWLFILSPFGATFHIAIIAFLVVTIYFLATGKTSKK